MDRIAVLDLGTNTFRLLIARPSRDGTLERCRQERRIVRVGEGVLGGGEIARGPLKRAVHALREFAALLRREGVTRGTGVATGVFREAKNAPARLQELCDAFGFPIRRITGMEEGAYALRGVRAGLKLQGEPALLVVDVGGGSTEFAVGGPGGDTRINSVPVGAVNLKERFEDALTWDPRAGDRMREWVHHALEHAIPGETGPAPGLVVGTGGTVTTLAYMEMGLKRYDPSRIHGSRLGREALERLLSDAVRYPLDRLRRSYHLEKGRADLVRFGATLLREIMERLPVSTLTVSDYGLLEGVAVEMLARRGAGKG